MCRYRGTPRDSAVTWGQQQNYYQPLSREGSILCYQNPENLEGVKWPKDTARQGTSPGGSQMNRYLRATLLSAPPSHPHLLWSSPLVKPTWSQRDLDVRSVIVRESCTTGILMRAVTTPEETNPGSWDVKKILDIPVAGGPPKVHSI